MWRARVRSLRLNAMMLSVGIVDLLDVGQRKLAGRAVVLVENEHRHAVLRVQR